MVKKSFRLMLLGAFALMSSVFVACDKYDDDIKGLQTQIDELKASVASLQSAINGGAVITNVTANAEGIVVTLSNGSNYTIKNGKDGQNGQNGNDGKNGSVVTIGENGNWFIDGVDTGKPSQGPAGANGTNGTDGKDADLVYFVPCTDKECENYGQWEKFVNGVKDATYVGESWLLNSVLTAVFNPETGALEFHGVEGDEDGIVAINNAHLASLAIIPEEILSETGLPIYYNYLITALDENDEEFLVASNNLKMSYRVNPTNADLTGVEYSFINRTVKVRATGDKEDLLTLVSAENTNGELKVEAKVNKIVDFFANNKANIFALKAKTANGEVVSDYATVESPKLTDFAIVDIWNLPKNKKWNHECPVNEPAVSSAPCASFVYTGSIDLDEIAALAETKVEEKLVADLGFEVKYKFTKAGKDGKYVGSDGETDQNKFVTIDSENVVKVDSEWLSKGKAAIGRTPVFYVEASVNDVVLASAYVKLLITETEVEAKEPITVVVGPETIEYSDLTAKKGMKLEWEQFNTEVYEVLGMSPREFYLYYSPATAQWSCPTGVEGFLDEGIGTNGYEINSETGVANILFDPEKILFGKDSATLVFTTSTTYAAIYPTVTIKFMYEITHETSFPALNDEYILDEPTIVDGEELETVQVKGKLLGDPATWTLQAEMKEFFEDYMANYEAPGNHSDVVFDIVGYVLDDNSVFASDFDSRLGAELLNADDYVNTEIRLTTPLAADEDYRTYVVRMIQTMANDVECYKYFAIKFVRPFNVFVDDVTLRTYQANPDTVDVKELVTVKDLDGNVLYKATKVTAFAEQYYKFTQEMFDEGITYELAKLDNTWGFEDGTMKLKLEGSELIWYNGGGDLQKNKDTEYKVTLTIPGLAADEQYAKVTVLSTANSK